MLVADTSFLVLLANERQQRRIGPAERAFQRHQREGIVISVVCAAEFLRGRRRLPAVDFLSRWTAENVTQRTADRWALIQTRGPTLGDNDGWVVATAQILGAGVIGRDKAFETVPGLRYIKIPE